MKPTLTKLCLGFGGLVLVTALAIAQQTPPPPPPPANAPTGAPTQAAPGNPAVLSPRPPQAQGVDSTTQPTGPAPKLELSQKEWNFGEVWQGEPIQVELTVKNVGEGPMTIEVRSSCGCTVPTRPRSPLNPGESDVMKISYNSAKKKGPASQNVTIITNDPTQRSVAFGVKGTVKPLYELKPVDGLVFGALASESSESRTVEIVNKYTDKMNLQLKQGVDTGNFNVTIKELEPGMRYELTAATKPPLSDGKAKAEIVLVTGNEKLPEIKIPINAFVQPPVAIRPAKLFLPKNSPQPLTRSVFVTCNADKPVKITGYKATPESIKVEIPTQPTTDKTASKQLSYELKVILPPGEQIAEDAKPMIEIMTDAADPKFQKFTIAVQMIDQTKAPNLQRSPGASSTPGAPGGAPTAGGATALPGQPIAKPGTAAGPATTQPANSGASASPK